MKYAIYLGHSRDKNFGDWWLYEVIRKALNSVRLLAFDRIVLRKRLQILVCRLWASRLIPRCDFVVLGGGTIMMPTRDYFLSPLLNASDQHFSIGTGAKSTQERLAFGLLTQTECEQQVEAYSGFKRLTVRGPLSLESLLEAGVKREIEIVGDPFLGMFRAEQTINQNNTKSVLLNVANLDLSQGHYWSPDGGSISDLYDRLISSLCRAKYQTQLVVCAPIDLPFAVSLSKRFALPQPIVALDFAACDELFRNHGKVIATRLHFMIYSVLRGVPTASLNYQDKHLDLWHSISSQRTWRRLSELKLADVLEECERAWHEFGTQWEQLRSQIILLNERRARLYQDIANFSEGRTMSVPC